MSVIYTIVIANVLTLYLHYIDTDATQIAKLNPRNNVLNIKYNWWFGSTIVLTQQTIINNVV